MTLDDKKGSGGVMNCQAIEDQGVIERYLAERLSAGEAEAFERHYLACRHCFEELQLRHAAAIELLRRSAAAKALHRPPRFLGMRWAATGAAVIFGALLSLIYFDFQRQTLPEPKAQSVPQQPKSGPQQPDVPAVLAQMASVEQAPSYVPTPLRGGESTDARDRLERGMKAYTDGRYKDAIVLLSRAAESEPQNDLIAFYLGIAYLLDGKPAEAIQQLSKLTAAGNPYQEPSHWYIARASLMEQNVLKARAELEAVVRKKGAYSVEAEKILALLRN